MAIAISLHARFFARLRELTGTETEQVTVAPGATLADVYDAVVRTHSALPPREAVRAALNHEFSDWSAEVSDGDEVAFIPPVSGGR